MGRGYELEESLFWEIRLFFLLIPKRAGLLCAFHSENLPGIIVDRRAFPPRGIQFLQGRPGGCLRGEAAH